MSVNQLDTMTLPKKSRRAKPSRFSLKLLILIGLASIFALLALFFQLSQVQSDTKDINRNAQEDLFNNDLKAALKPFEGETFPLKPIFESQSGIWGSLNSGHYFGLKLSSPDSIETSLLWFKNELNRDGRLSMRHICDQNDNLHSYSWLKHDFRTFGIQEIQDQGFEIITSYLKQSESDHNWTAKIQVNPLKNSTSTSKYISVIHYITTSDLEDEIHLEKQPRNSDSARITIVGHSKHVGQFEMKIFLDPEHQVPFHESYYHGYVDKSSISISSFLHSKMIPKLLNKTRIFTLSGKDKIEQHNLKIGPNIIAYQLILEPPGSMMITFSTESSQSMHQLLKSYDNALAKRALDFDQKFQLVFPISLSNLQLDENPDIIDKFAKTTLSNMIGSIGYFYGYSFIGSQSNPGKIAPYGPIQLLTGVPSRSFFPRGFLWDEGFHNLLISRWDPDLSKKIIKSWFEIMNANGWIPREVILGIESMRRVPDEFITQKISNANPPVMFIVLEQMLDENLIDDSTLRTIYPKFKSWYNWFNVTQSGLKSSTYRWRGRDELSVNMLNPKTLTSGLDDYPRASHPSEDEYHVDLRCWMALSARTLTKISAHLNDRDYQRIISADAAILLDNSYLDELHWSSDHKMYCDYGHNTEKAELIRVTKTRRSSSNNDLIETYQVLERHSTGHPLFGCVPEYGYVSLFPMLLRILDHRSEKLGIILEKLRDPNELWSNFGIRSLSKSSRYYNKYNTEHDKPYWRGAIWLNINYLVLSSLKHYSNLDGPYKEKSGRLFSELKQNLVKNVLRQYVDSGYIWENYSDETGHGQGSHPFTGWSSLILLIMTSE